MDDNVRRGLGLLAVAGLGLAALHAGRAIDGGLEAPLGDPLAVVGLVVLSVGWVGGMFSLIVGLLMGPPRT